MPTTRGYPYPAGADDVDVPGDIQALAEAVDTDVASLPIIQAKKSIIAAEQSTSSSSYAYLGTQDKVTGIVVPAGGILAVAFDALWKESVASTTRAAIFVGDTTQLKIRRPGGNGAAVDGVEQAAGLRGDTTTYMPLVSTPFGLASVVAGSAWPQVADAGPIALGLLSDSTYIDVDGDWVEVANDIEAGAATYLGGVCLIRLAAGTYEVGVKFKASSGSVTAKERKLWVWTMAFA